MAAIALRIHLAANMKWGKISDLAGGTVVVRHPPGENGGEPVEPMALAMIEDDEINVYVFTEAGKQNLLKDLTGGVIIP